MAELSEKARNLLSGAAIPILATIGPDGHPHAQPVWIELTSDGRPTFNTVKDMQKDLNLIRDPRVTLTVVDPGNSYSYSEIRGTVERTQDGAEAQIDRLAKKYLGEDVYPWRRPGQERTSYTVTVEKEAGI